MTVTWWELAHTWPFLAGNEWQAMKQLGSDIQWLIKVYHGYGLLHGDRRFLYSFVNNRFCFLPAADSQIKPLLHANRDFYANTE